MNDAPFLAVAALAAYLIGSIPTAWLLVRRAMGRDLREEGSGNIGALNAFEVSRSRKVGITVLLIDLVKGAVPMLLVGWVVPDHAMVAGTAYIALVAGHNFSPWIGFRGGRGLAPAAGASLVFNPHLLIMWALMWVVTFVPRRRVHDGNLGATLLAPVLLAGLAWRGWGITGLAVPTFLDAGVGALVCLLILIAHRNVIADMFRRA